MNLDLILENIRLGHIEKLLQEATSDLEVVRGQRLINESIMQLQNILMEEVVNGPKPINGMALGAGIGTIAGAGLGAITGHEVGDAYGDELNGPIQHQMYHEFATDPESRDQLAHSLVNHPVATTQLLNNPAPVAGMGTGMVAGAAIGAGLGGLGARRLMRR